MSKIRPAVRCAALLALWLRLSTGALGAERLASEYYGKLFTDGPMGKSAVALTFDDGPGLKTSSVLEILRRHGAKATFFMLGIEVRRHPDLAQRILQEGHQVASHNYLHTNYYFYKKPDRERRLADEMRSAKAEIRRATGVDPVFVRMPHGYVRDWVKGIAAQEKVILVNWTYGSDWTKLSREQMLQGYLSRLRPGAILLMHDGGNNPGNTAWILERVLQEMEKRKLKPARIDELLGFPVQTQ